MTDLLLWVGMGYYPTIESFVDEASVLGCSKRINLVPASIVLGESKAWLLHDTAVTGRGRDGAVRENIAVIFGYFVINSVDYVVDDEKLVEMLSRRHRRVAIRRVPSEMAATEPARLSGRRQHGGLYLVGGPVVVLDRPVSYPYRDRKFRGFKKVHDFESTK